MIALQSFSNEEKKRYAAKASFLMVFAALVLSMLSSCKDDELTTIPPSADQDHPPTITMVNYVPGGNGQVDQAQSTTTSTVYARPNTELLLNGNAANPGGVKAFSITVTQDGQLLYAVGTNAAPDANNKVPTILRIVGFDKAKPNNSGGEPLKINLSSPVTVAATASNFSNQTTSILVTYQPLGPISANLSADPTQLYLSGNSILTWSTSNATTVDITLLGNVPLAGSSQVSLNSPTTNSATTYTLTARNPFESATASATITVFGHVTATITANPSTIDQGNSSTLSWSTTNATVVSITPPVSGGNQLSGSSQVSPGGTTTYTLTANNPFEKQVASVKLTVNPPPATRLDGVYVYDDPGTQPHDITLNVTGSIISANGTNGRTQFQESIPVPNVGPGINTRVPFSVSNLRPGTWNLTVKPNCCGGQSSCANVSLPRLLVTFSVSSTQGIGCF